VRRIPEKLAFVRYWSSMLTAPLDTLSSPMGRVLSTEKSCSNLPDRKAPQQHAAEVEVVFDDVSATS